MAPLIIFPKHAERPRSIHHLGEPAINCCATSNSTRSSTGQVNTAVRFINLSKFVWRRLGRCIRGDYERGLTKPRPMVVIFSHRGAEGVSGTTEVDCNPSSEVSPAMTRWQPDFLVGDYVEGEIRDTHFQVSMLFCFTRLERVTLCESTDREMPGRSRRAGCTLRITMPGCKPFAYLGLPDNQERYPVTRLAIVFRNGPMLGGAFLKAIVYWWHGLGDGKLVLEPIHC